MIFAFMRILCSTFKAGVLACLLSANVLADFGITVGDGLGRTGNIATYAVGQQVVVPFVINTGGDPLAAYDLAIDFAQPGYADFSSLFSDVSIDFTGSQVGASNSGSVNTDLAGQLDAVDDGNGGNPFRGLVTFDLIAKNIDTANRSGNNLKLFDLKFTVGANASGIYDIKAIVRTDPNNVGFADNSSFSFINSASNAQTYELASTVVNSNPFAFQITAVPEPSSFLLVAGIAGVAAWRGRRKLLRFRSSSDA